MYVGAVEVVAPRSVNGLDKTAAGSFDLKAFPETKGTCHTINLMHGSRAPAMMAMPPE
jgi:hypothetical protein